MQTKRPLRTNRHRKKIRQGDKERGRQGESGHRLVSLSPCLPFSLSSRLPFFHTRPLNPEPSFWPRSFTVPPQQAGRRLDVFLAELLPDFSRVTLQRSIEAGRVWVGGEVCSKPSYRV